MDFILIIILFALVLIVCLLLYFKVISLSKQLKTQDGGTLEIKVMQQQLADNNATLNELRLRLAEQLSKQFADSQELGFKQQQSTAEHLTRLSESIQTKLNDGLKFMHETTGEHLKTLSNTNTERLTSIQESVEKKLDDNQKKYIESFEKTKEDLGKMQHAAAQMREASNDSKTSIERLNDIFGKGTAKAYGTFGENMLESVLADTIPGSYETQFRIPGSSEIIDFCIKLADETIGIDSKFPLDKYDTYRTSTNETHDTTKKDFLQAIKIMVDDISKKYVASKFFSQVYIYFPSDSIYLEVTGDPSMSKLLRSKKIFPCSPSTILPLIAVVAQYNKRVKIQDDTEIILKGLEKLDKFFSAFRAQFVQLGEKLRLAQDRYSDSEKQLDGFDRTVKTLTNNQTTLLEDTQE
jgi:DNA anti-recombination protein RmuC